ncbi:hypothetical protein ONZ45_g4749 [Pleurotus djamor]|nr:hypothetical protein ONZ45_g4749 [Pleurotus djamor]
MAKVLSNPSHGLGHTCVALSPDGRHEMIFRIWDLDAGLDHEPDTAADAEGGVMAVAVAHDYWVSGSEDSEVRRYVKDKGEIDGLVTTAKGVPIRCLAIDPKGKRVAVASDEISAKVVDIEDIMQTTCGSDGKILAWDVSTTTPKLVKTLDGIIPTVIDSTAPEFLHNCAAVWHPSGQYFFVASRNHEIITISRSDWAKTSTYQDGEVTGAVTAIAVSPNGVYMASAVQGKVFVWSTQTRRVIASQAGSAGATVTELHFSPTRNLLVWTDSDGVFFRWPEPIPSSFPDPIKSSRAASTTTLPVKAPKEFSLFGDDTTIDDVLDGGVVDDIQGMGDGDDWIIDDLGGGVQDDEPAEVPETRGYVKEMVSITKAQPPFQPGSTPMENKKRYLAHNTVGVIEVTDQDIHHIVNVEFFDRSMRKNFHFNDMYKYNLGYLGERGALFACQPENDHPAHVKYTPYGEGIRVIGIAAGGSEPARSLAQAQALDHDLESLGNVVIATSEGDLTFLSGTGLERRILALEGDYVTMAAGNEWVFVVHRAGSTTIDGSQNLAFSLINFDDFSVRQRGLLPVPKGHTLKWVGITSGGAPAIYDSTGRLHILTKYRIPHHGSWTRILDTNLLERRKGKDESYWPVGVDGSTFVCLILKGRQTHPGFPRPLIQELPITMPFRGEDTHAERIQRELMLIDMEYDQLEDELTTNELSVRETAVDKLLLHIIQAAMKSGNYPRVIEVAKMLHFSTAIGAAITLADYYTLIGMKEKLGVLKEELEDDLDSRNEVRRDKRNNWLRREPMPKTIIEKDTYGARKPFQSSAPPPAIHRPALAPASVSIERTRFSSAVPRESVPSSWDEPSDLPESSSSADGKRKRIEDSDGFDIPPPPPKQKINPFAKKPNQDNNRNPFARKGDSKPVQKSESFFDRVDAAESAVKPKKPFAKPKDKVSKSSSGTTKVRTLMDAGLKIKSKSDTTASQQTDITMTDDSQGLDSQATILVGESPPADDSQERSRSPDWPPLGDTQLEDAS